MDLTWRAIGLLLAIAADFGAKCSQVSWREPWAVEKRRRNIRT